MADDFAEKPSDDALQLLAICEAANDAHAAQKVREVIEDFNLTAETKSHFFRDLRAFFDLPANHGKRPRALLGDFVNGPGRKYLLAGEEVPGLTVDLSDPV